MGNKNQKQKVKNKKVKILGGSLRGWQQFQGQHRQSKIVSSRKILACFVFSQAQKFSGVVVGSVRKILRRVGKVRLGSWQGVRDTQDALK